MLSQVFELFTQIEDQSGCGKGLALRAWCSCMEAMAPGEEASFVYTCRTRSIILANLCEKKPRKFFPRVFAHHPPASRMAALTSSAEGSRHRNAKKRPSKRTGAIDGRMAQLLLPR